MKTLGLSAAAVRALVKWYGRHRRDLPWRRNCDPYSIWISEILLQQTQVETVRPYFLRFMKAFPSLEVLAHAHLDEVLKVWEGCGYYARARHLHEAAKLLSRAGGVFPQTAKEWEELPGVGPYTAAAIASICFGEPVAALDGNVQRVIARLLLERRAIDNGPAKKRLERAAAGLMQTACYVKIHPGLFNQAMMELGAIVCKPRQARCGDCPVSRECRAYRELEDVTVLPRKNSQGAIPHYDIGAAILRKDGKILITKRPLDGLLGGLWEFPGGKRHSGETLKECVARELFEELGVSIEVGKPVAKVRHAYSHFKFTLHVFECRIRKGRLRKIGVADAKWVTPDELSGFAFPKADQMVIARMLEEGVFG